MKGYKYTVLALIILFSANANSGWIDKQGNSVPDSENMKSTKDFIAQLIITDDEAQVLKNWNTPSKGVYFPTSDIIEKDKIITAFIVFGGCLVDKNGNCDLRMQITVYQPDGSLYAKLPVMEVWSGKPVPPNRDLGLSVDYMRVIIENDEPLGKYRIETKVMDKNSGVNMQLSSHFTAVAPK